MTPGAADALLRALGGVRSLTMTPTQSGWRYDAVFGNGLRHQGAWYAPAVEATDWALEAVLRDVLSAGAEALRQA